ncbi:MAG TPA: DivIVA domain-containing protein [Acidimicrobiales bacterium]
MDSSDNSLSAIDSIDTVAFKIGLRGYGVDEVDEFLERLSSEVRQLQDLAKQQRQQLRQAAERISQLDARGPTTGPVNVTPAAPTIRTSSAAGPEQVTSMIALAQKFIEQAQQEAEEKAREFTVAAQERAREIVTEARSRAEDEVNRLNGLKQRLSEDVDTLTHQLQAEKTRISGVLAEFTRWVESALQAGTPRASTPVPTPPAATPSGPGAPPATLAARPLQTPPPAPAPGSSPSTIGQVLKFDQTSRDDR